MKTLSLGITDRGQIPGDRYIWLSKFHRWMATDLKRQNKFRGEGSGRWFSFKAIDGRDVRDLQLFLREKGFFPNSTISGIFGYGTMSAVRLFQEYVRNQEGLQSIGVPDGIVGAKTQEHITRWKTDGIMNGWSEFSATKPTTEYLKWFSVLDKARAHYLTQSNPVLDQVRGYAVQSDTFAPEKWSFRPWDTHLIGIRRNVDIGADNRPNDDLFILLIRGMVFKFWGSTDPNPTLSREDEAYLVEGQHKYRFSWHKASSRVRIYKALRPFSKGALIFRDHQHINKLTGENVERGLDPPNTTINIHWSGDGDFNFSAGCQVIAGKSYLDHHEKLVNCQSYAADSYAGLDDGKTRGAYNVLTDLVICYSPPGEEIVWYTLGREENLLDLDIGFSSSKLTSLLERLKLT